LKQNIPFVPKLHRSLELDTFVENFSGAEMKALAASTPKFRPREDTGPEKPAVIQDVIRMLNLCGFFGR
jgi:hypothetical protein